MKRTFNLILFITLIMLLSSCSNSGNGELVGVQKREKFYQPDPFGMVYIPMGSFVYGVGSEDISFAHMNQPRTVSVSAFYMDQTEITNNEYRQFVYWVRDSIARRKLGEANPEAYFIEDNKKTGEVYDPPFLNWKTKINWNGEQEREALEELFIPERERFFRKKEVDTRKLYYEYYWVDYNAAAVKDFSSSSPVDAGLSNRPQGMSDRSVYVRQEKINIYPDTLCWIHDYAYSYNDPMTERYFWHPAYDNYPVVGVNWRQAKAFCIWRTQLLSTYLISKGNAVINEFRLPTEAEWEWAARGGNSKSPYPWGGPFTRNAKGCFLANFKPLRGDYASDGGLMPTIAAHFPPNDFDLYDMAGNVAEWTNDAYDESTTNFTWDMNPAYSYNAKDSDPPTMKRKVVKGGSWKDIAFFLQVNNRTYEFQDTSKCYVGFRCVQNYLGRQKDDKPSKASKIYN